MDCNKSITKIPIIILENYKHMKKTAAAFLLLTLFISCKKSDDTPAEMIVNEDPATYKEIASLNLGGSGSAEITTYDPQTKH